MNRRNAVVGLSQALTAGVMGLHPGVGFTATQGPSLLRLCFEQADVRPWRTREGTGLNFSLINAVAINVGVRVEYVPLPWKRCLAELKSNAVDGAIGASFKSDRLEMGAYPGGKTPDASKRLYVERYVLVRRKFSAIQWNGRAFSHVDGPVGTQLGYSIGEQLLSMDVLVDDGSSSIAELLQKLMAGRVSAAAVLGNELRYWMRQEPKLADKLEVLPQPLVEKPYFLMFSHRLVETSPALANEFWNSVEQQRKAAPYRLIEAQALEGIAP
ncbi:substrate-binding periplasmic protein [Rhodoferax aquaticus]|nr:transporter substrate-binding domain-containing protein [Rhodoferax aquaticus]